jgi:hypothetical protein
MPIRCSGTLTLAPLVAASLLSFAGCTDEVATGTPLPAAAADAPAPAVLLARVPTPSGSTA